MHLLLINPPFEGIYRKLGFIFPPLGLAYLAAIAREAGWKCTIVDLEVQPRGLDVLSRNKFDLVGITGDTCRHSKVVHIAREVKKQAPVPVIIGGPHATYMDQSILNQESVIDAVIRREGELTLQALLREWKGMEEQTLETIKGITFRTSSGTVVRNEDREFVAELDSLPKPARDLLDMRKYRVLELRKRKITPIITSRGCPFNCPFCCSSQFAGSRWRKHSIERVMEEIKEVTDEYGFEAVAFLDDTFTVDMKRVMSIAAAIIEEEIDIRWWCFSRSDIILKHPDSLSQMYQSGARYVFMGMESGDDHVLQRIKRGTSTDEAMRAVNLLLDNGIETMASYMIADVYDDPTVAEKTIEYACKVPSGAAQFSIVTPFPGTVLYEQLQDRLLHRQWEYFDCTHLVYQHSHFTPKTARRYHNRAYRRFYLRPKRIMDGLLSTFRGRGVKLSKILPALFRQSRDGA